MIIGVHASVRAGLVWALEEARALECESLQILPYPRHHDPSVEELAEFAAARRALALKILLVHSRFVPSLASREPRRRALSVAHLAHELRLCAGLGGDAYVLHAGAYSPGDSFEDGARAFAESVRRAICDARFSGEILLENVPGGGRRMGATLEELAALRDALGAGVRAGFCLDTAHAWAAGYDLSRVEGVWRLLVRARRLLGEDGVRAFHLNDTRALLGSGRENHWHWGQGRLGTECLGAFVRREEFAATPAILETPKEPGADAANLALARSLAAA